MHIQFQLAQQCIQISTRINSSSVHTYIFVCFIRNSLRVILQGFVDPKCNRNWASRSSTPTLKYLFKKATAICGTTIPICSGASPEEPRGLALPTPDFEAPKLSNFGPCLIFPTFLPHFAQYIISFIFHCFS